MVLALRDDPPPSQAPPPIHTPASLHSHEPLPGRGHGLPLQQSWVTPFHVPFSEGQVSPSCRKDSPSGHPRDSPSPRAPPSALLDEGALPSPRPPGPSAPYPPSYSLVTSPSPSPTASSP